MSSPCRIYNPKRSNEECERKYQCLCLTDEQQSQTEKWFVKCVKAELKQTPQIHGVFLSLLSWTPQMLWFSFLKLLLQSFCMGVVFPGSFSSSSTTCRRSSLFLDCSKYFQINRVTLWLSASSLLLPSHNMFTLMSISKGDFFYFYFFLSIGWAFLLIMHIYFLSWLSGIALCF